MPQKPKYKPEYVDQARIACRLGAIDQDLADLFSVAFRTIHNWRNTYPEFAKACEEGKIEANDVVRQALFKRATGAITYKEALTREGCPVKLETQHPPDTGACMAWLYNRDRDNWKRDPSKIDDDGGDDAVHKISRALKDIANKLPD